MPWSPPSRRRRARRAWALGAGAALVLCLSPVAWSQGREQQTQSSAAASLAELDRLGLAAVLVRDGFYERAAGVLGQIDETREDLDRARFHTLRGLVRLNRNNLAAAIEDFRAAQVAGQKNPVLYVYLAQAHFRLGDYASALDAIAKAGPAAAEYPALYLLRAEAHWKLDNEVGAFQALAAGATQFPEQAEFLRRQVFYLMEMGAFQAAAELGRAYLQQTEGDPKDYLAIAVALHRGGDSRTAINFLEAARLRFPGSAELTKALAQIYFDRGQAVTAANVYDKAAALNHELTREAAEFNRRAGNLLRALNLNAQVDDPKEKLRQRIAILVELERYAQVAGAEAALNRVGLLADQDIRYALAYSYFKAGEYAAAERHLSRLTDGDLVRQATQLRQYMQQCRNEPWLCA